MNRRSESTSKGQKERTALAHDLYPMVCMLFDRIHRIFEIAMNYKVEQMKKHSEI